MKRIPLRVFSVFVIFLIAVSARASGRSVGNGGDVILCEEASGVVTSVELLDFYEGRALKGIVADLGDAQLSVDKKIDIALSRLRRVSPTRAERYAEHAATFYDETLFLSDAKLADIPDTGSIVIPNGCRIAQVANQSAPLYPDDKRYVIDKSLWDILDNDSRAGLILHEVIYREALELGHENSVSVRILNANLTSTKIETMSVQAYTEFLTNLGFGSNSVQGVLISLSPRPPEFYLNGMLKNAMVVEGAKFELASQTVLVRGEISFFPSGKLRSLSLFGNQTIFFAGESRNLSPYEVSFFESGSIESATFNGPAVFKSRTYEVTIAGAAYFHENGLIRLANAMSGWIEIAGKVASVFRVLQIDETGKFREGTLVDPILFPVSGRLIPVHEVLRLDSVQRPVMITLAQESELSLGTGAVVFATWWKIFFHLGTDRIRTACLARDSVLRDPNGQTKLFPARTVLEFNLDGSVSSAEDRC